MKKITFLALMLVVCMGMSAGSLYTRNDSTHFFSYTGPEMDEIVAVDFSDMQPGDTLYDPAKSQHDTLNILEFQNLGLYKWCYYASRKIDGVTYAPLAWNSNKALDGTNDKVATSHRPTLYTPSFKNGIHYVILKACLLNGGSFYALAKNDTTDWVSTQTLVPEAKTAFKMVKNLCVTDTIVFDTPAVKQFCFNRNNGGYGFLIQIQVIPYGHEEDVIPVKSFNVTGAPDTMEVSQTAQLTGIIRPFNATNQKITWKSSNENRATVDSTGLISAVSPGEVTITATLDTFVIKNTIIIKGEIPVTSIELDVHEITVGEHKYGRVNATVLPTDASKPDVTWISRDTAVATVNGGLIFGVLEGETWVIAQAGEKADSCKVTVEWVMPEPCDYQLTELSEDSYAYTWTGDPQTEPITIDFTKLTWDSIHDTQWPDWKTTVTSGFTPEITQYNNIGFLGFYMYENRSMSAFDWDTTLNVLFTNGKPHIDGQRVADPTSVPMNKRSALYFPYYPNGIKQVRIYGGVQTNSRVFMLHHLDTLQGLQGDSLAMVALPKFTVGNTIDEYVIDPQGVLVQQLRMVYQSTEQVYFLSLEVIPNKGTGIERVLDNRFFVRSFPGGILFNAKEDATVAIYSMTGYKLQTIKLFAGEKTIVPMPAGAYIVDTQKIIVQ